MIKKILTGPLLLSVVLTAPAAMAWNGDDDSACEQTATTMLRACRHDVQDDYYVTLANCQNLAASSERYACYEEARATRREEGENCRDVAEARVEACEILGEQRYDTDPLLANDFVHPDDVDESSVNPYVSVIAGHTYVLRAGEEEEEVVVVHVTEDTREILGVECRVVVDIVFEESEEDGEVEYELVEVTDDWFAQTVDGDVVYCGEIARNFEDGVLRDLDGSFEAGVDFARSGYLVRRLPVPGAAHRQEYALGEAEDIIQYVSLGAEPSEAEGGNNPLFSCATNQCLQTFDFAPVEPEATEFKYYLPGTGFVLAVAMEDGEYTGEREVLTCIGDDLGVLEESACGLADAPLLLEELCTLSPEVFCDD